MIFLGPLRLWVRERVGKVPLKPLQFKIHLEPPSWT